MIDLIYRHLHAYGDWLHDKKRENDRKIVWECERLVHKAYVESEKVAKVITDRKAKDEVEELVLSIPDIVVMFDTLDGTIYYTLDNWHFDSPKEVIKYIIKSRKEYRETCQNEAKRQYLEFIKKMLETTRVSQCIPPRYTIKGKFVKARAQDIDITADELKEGVSDNKDPDLHADD